MRTQERPPSIKPAVTAVTIVAGFAVAPGLNEPGRDGLIAVLAVGVAVFAVSFVDAAAATLAAAAAFLIFDGFVEGHHGDLAWDGRHDAIRVAVLCAAEVLGLAAGTIRARIRRHDLTTPRTRTRTRTKNSRPSAPTPAPVIKLPRQRVPPPPADLPHRSGQDPSR